MTTTPPHPLPTHQHVRTTTVAGLVIATAYVGTVVTANWTSIHWSALVLGQVVVPAGTLWAGITFTLRDLLHDTLGAWGVITGIAVGTGMSWLLASPQIAVASVVAFAVSETLDSVIYTLLRHRSRIWAVAMSNVVGLLVDTLLFVPLAFGSLTAVPGQLVGKTIATALALPLLRLVQPCRRQVVGR